MQYFHVLHSHFLVFQLNHNFSGRFKPSGSNKQGCTEKETTNNIEVYYENLY